MPRRLTNLLFGLAFISCGAIFLVFMAQTSTLECRRVEAERVDCQLSTSLLGIWQSGQQGIRQVEAAVVAENCGEDCTYRVELVTPQGNYPLTYYYSSGTGPKQETAALITEYLYSGSREPLNLQLRASAGARWFIFIPLVFVIIGLGAFASIFFRPKG